MDLEKVRHSLAHIMALAVKRTFKTTTINFGIGPDIDTGFYYDFDLDIQIKDNDLQKIEDEMKKIIKEGLEFKQTTMDVDQAIDFLKKAKQIYKVELAKNLKAEGEKKLSFYSIENEFIDLCSGPHIKNTKEIDPTSFQLDRIAGAYWLGDEKNPMLQRIYGLAFENKKKLKEFINLREEAKKRDHRKLGKELDLFHIDEKVGLGLPLWHPKGAILWKIVEDYWYKRHLESDYQLVRSPHIGNKILWETSGHWNFFDNNMFPPLEAGQTLEERQKKEKVKESEEYLIKPMNCPFHIQIYKNSPKSYRDFPLKWAECGTVYRFEKKGELSGLTRVRGFTQDDAHIICRQDQVEKELKEVIDFIISIFEAFGFDLNLIHVYLSLRDPNNKKKYAGNDQGWEFTQKILKKVAIEKKLNFTEEVGEAAFYGPKLDFKLKDVLNREWQCSTLQFDFNLPDRFDMSFINNKGQEEKPYVLHRALLGSFERFFALLIEHYAGAFPVWLSPVQIKLLSVGEKHIDFVHKLAQEFKKKKIRIEIDDSSETVGNKIRKAIQEKIPYVLVIGDKEMKSENLAVRDRGSEKIRTISKKDLIKEILDQAK